MSRTVVVTGGAGAIGAAVAARFAAEGETVVRVDVADDARVRCDVADEDSVSEAFAQIRAEVGPVDVLVNAAGITGAGSLLDEDPDHWRRILDVNLTGTYLCCREALTDMVGPADDPRGGVILNVASVNARFGGSALSGPAYAASKGGVVTLTRFIAREHAAQGVRAVAVAPGPHDTPMWQALDQERRTGILASLPGGGIGDPGDLAGVISFLAGPDARFVNGATIDINGGQWMG